MIAGDYDMAGFHDRNYQLYLYSVKLDEERMNEDNRIDLLFQRWQSLQADMQEVNDKWDKRMNDYAQDDQNRWNKLIEAQNVEIGEFVEFWKDPVNLRTYNKPSSRLLQLREQERYMAVVRMYAEAKELKVVADRVQREETEQAQKRINDGMRIDRIKLEEKHQKERERHLNHRRQSLSAMELERQHELGPITTAMQQIRFKKPVQNTLKSSRVIQERGEGVGPAISPRTRELYSVFRSQKKTDRLPVRGAEEEVRKSSSSIRSSSLKRTGRESANENADGSGISEEKEDAQVADDGKSDDVLHTVGTLTVDGNECE
jgi:hypothetical protein